MAKIGNFKKASGEYRGQIATLALQAKSVRIAAEDSASSNGARAAGGAAGAYAAGAAGKTGRAAVASGLANVAKSAAGAATSPLKRAADSLKANYASAKGAAPKDTTATPTPDGPPAWAAAMRRRQTMSQGASIAAHTLKGGDSHASGSGPDITDKS